MITKMSASSMNSKSWYRSMLAGNDAFNPGAYDLISTAYGNGTTDLITFSSIPSIYKHLQIRAVFKCTSNFDTEFLAMRVNGLTSSGQYSHSLTGNGSTVASASSGSLDYLKLSATVGSSANAGTNSFASAVIDVLDYASTSKNKTIRCFGGETIPSGYSRISLNSGLYTSTSAITSMSFYNDGGGAWTSTTRFSLYGIKGA